MNCKLRKAQFTRNMSRNKFLRFGKSHWEEDRKMRNYVVKIRKVSLKTISRSIHDDVIKYFPRYWPFVRGLHWVPVNSLHKDQWRGALMFSLICVWIYGWVNNGGACELRRNGAYYAVTLLLDKTGKRNSGMLSHLLWVTISTAMVSILY